MHDLLVPRAALPYLEVTAPADQHHVELAPLRREALDVLAAGYRSPGRLALGLLAWAAVLGGVVLLSRVQETAVVVGAATLIAVGGGLAVVVLRAGGRLTRAASGWLRVPAVGVSGRDAGPLYGVVRGRAALALVAGAAAIALLVVLVILLSGSGAVAGAAFGRAGPAVGEPVSTEVLAALAAGAGTTAVAAVASFGGVRRILLAAWARPTVAPAEPPTVELDLPGHRGAVAVPPARGPAAPGDRVTRPTVEVVLSTGHALRRGVTLVGRSPFPRPGDVIDDVLVLTDQTVTKTHATVVLEEDVVRVVDRASTNGTVLETPEGSLVRCRPWQVTTVRAPAIIHLGHTRLLVRPSPAHQEVA